MPATSVELTADDYPRSVQRWILVALASGPATTSELVWRTGARLRWLLSALRDMQRADQVRLTTRGRYRLTTRMFR